MCFAPLKGLGKEGKKVCFETLSVQAYELLLLTYFQRDVSSASETPKYGSATVAGKGTYSFLHSSLYLTSSVLQISPEQVFQYFFLLKGKKKKMHFST